jgi:hypothetical protein
MEPVEWILGILIIFGGVELWDKNKGASSASSDTAKLIVSEASVYTKGRYYLSEQGYYITDLTSAPTATPGCDDEIFTANLAEPNTDDTMNVEAVNVECGG